MPANNQTNDNIIKAFEPDYLSRKALAVEWTDALFSSKINHHLVISVSGDWGTGKTYLAKNWHKYLEEQGYFTCYIDAHKKDYAEDPLLVFIEELNSNINQYYKENMGWWRKIACKIPVIKKKVPKFLINSSTLIAGVEVSSVINAIRIIIQLAQKFLSSKIKDKIKYLELYEKYISDFREALAKFTCLFDKPVVIFIDELDRSNPKFVIKLIEQLKHIFEIPNLAFILTVNKKELSNTIKGIYGSEMDGYAYYKKFTTHDFTLYPIEQIDEILINEFIKYTTNKYNEYNLSHDFIGMASSLSKRLNLSLRDIEQILDHLYYIKEKVYQSYHRDYLIICYFLRSLYLKNYVNFLLYSELSIAADNSLIAIKEKEPISKLNPLIEELMNGEYNNNDLLNIIKLILAPITDDTIHNFFEGHRIDVIWPPITGTNTFHEAEVYIYYPIFTHGYDENDIPIPCKTPKEVKERILSIRKNLIQLSMLGAVPKDNILE